MYPMELFSSEFWVAFQMAIIVLLLIMLGVFFLKTKESPPEEAEAIESEDAVVQDPAVESAEKIVALLEPLVKDAEEAARVFQQQILEKKQVIRQLNEALDSRIINLNLLLNRADTCLQGGSDINRTYGNATMTEFQDSVLELYEQGYDAESIAQKLDVSIQEAELVVTLKRKLIALEQG